MQKTSRINSDKSSLADKQKKHKHTTPNRSNNSVASRDASDTPRNASTTRSTSTARAMPHPPTRRIDRPRNASTTNTAHRPPTQHIDRPCSTSTTDTAPRPPTQHLVHRHSTSTTAQQLGHRHSTLTSPSRPIEQIFALFLSAQGQNSAITNCFT